jgi:hypothetical protein
MAKLPMKTVTLSVPDVKEVWNTHSHWVRNFIIMVVLIVGAFFGGRYYQFKYVDMNENIQRQQRGDLTPEEIELLKAKPDIKQLQSQIKTERELRIKAEKEGVYNKELVKKYNLKIESQAVIIANLKGSTNSGTFKFGKTLDGTENFAWNDEYNRFSLFIPDTKDTRSYFTYNQHFMINIVGYKQQSYDGALKVQTVHLWEVTGDGKKLREVDIDLSKSTFDFSIENQKNAMPAHHWLANMTSKGELAVTWLPINKFHNMVGFGLTGGAGSEHQFVGLTAMAFPPAWANSSFGVGVSVGYDPQDQHHVAWRFQVAWALSDLFKK